jgi:hypothetical protein
MWQRLVVWMILAASLFAPTAASAETFLLPVAFDRWMYPFNATPGVRATGLTFGAFGDPTFDQRDAQVLLGFDTSGIGGVPVGYAITGAKLTLTTAADNSFQYDPTYDAHITYDAGVDTDTGRPIEIYGVGLRGGFTGLTLDDASADPTLFKEQTSFSAPGPPSSGVRRAFASDYDGGIARDVSNNVLGAFDPNPWAVGQITGLTPGGNVPINTAITFDLDLANPDVVAYLVDGVNDGELFLAASSLHPAAQGGPPTYPVFYLDAGGVSLGDTATLELELTAVPEPASWVLLASAVAIALPLAARRLRRRRK